LRSLQKARRLGFTLVEVLVLIVLVVGIVGVVLIPGLLYSSRGYNCERNSSTSLKTLTSAEADFRANDRDWNHVNDFWTADVKGLYTMTSAAVRGNAGGTVDPPIKLIELSVASADADGSFFTAGGENMPLSSFAVPSAKAGYWFAALNSDLNTGKAYRQDTGGAPLMGPCHHESAFGFVAFPDSPTAGKYTFMVNENNTIYRSTPSLRPRTSALVPPGLGAVPSGCLDWPADPALKAVWSKLD
jgi:type II secretory pathway pseudopilin PulG